MQWRATETAAGQSVVVWKRDWGKTCLRFDNSGAKRRLGMADAGLELSSFVVFGAEHEFCLVLDGAEIK